MCGKSAVLLGAVIAVSSLMAGCGQSGSPSFANQSDLFASGEMKGLIFAKQSPFLKAHNRIKYEIFMYDVAKHKSNVVETPAFDF